MTPAQLEEIKKRRKAVTTDSVAWRGLEEFLTHANGDVFALLAEVERLRDELGKLIDCFEIHSLPQSNDVGCYLLANRVEAVQGIQNARRALEGKP